MRIVFNNENAAAFGEGPRPTAEPTPPPT